MSFLWLITPPKLVLCTLTNCVSAIIYTQYRKKLPWWGLRIALNYQSRNTNVEDTLKLYPLSRVIVIRWLFGPKSFLFMRFGTDLQCQACVSSFRADLKFNQKAAGYPFSICFITAPTGISCLTGHYCSSQGLQLGKTVGFCLLPFSTEICAVPSFTMKASH